MDSDIAELLWRDLEIFLLIGALLGIALGLLLIFRPQLLPSINNMANRWISSRHAGRLLNQGISTEHWFYQHHRPLGILVVLGAGYIFVHFGMLFNKDAPLQYLAGYVPAKLADGLLDAYVLSSLLGATIALFVGLLLWLRPGLLHGIEKEANRWVSLRRPTKVLDVQHDQVDRYVEHHARLAGGLLLMGSTYLFLVMIGLLI